MKANKQHKASVFSSLFSEPEEIRSLYPAISGETIAPDEPIEINTLEDVLFMDQINDLSFTVGDRLVVLVEHQSSINPNMALRLLMYAVGVYKEITDSDNLYSSKLIKIPNPEFYVLYNGEDEYPDKKKNQAFRFIFGLKR
ncbi:MAG: Rpn family recombination-promoting nuclease/putative transposase [Spirochaetaceae bacterium]|jgi:hypothetical protein|nr:Rpn family recombination-promoting nuclease/putative transposase [Spirochaetaceae bacterium]